MKQKEKPGWLVVVNPNAGTGKGQKDWKEISALLDKNGMTYKAVFTRKRLHAIRLVSDHIEKGFRKIIVVGGDGTMHEVVNGIFCQMEVSPADISVGMISIGTGNDWVRTHNVPCEYKKAIKVLKREDTLLQDVGVVHYMNSDKPKQRYFINMAGMGFDGLVAQKTNADKDRGKSNPLLYLSNLVSSLFAFKSTQIKVVVDGQEVNDKVFSMSVGIGKYNGGGMQQSPDAIPDDGLFDVTIIKDMSKWSVVASIRRLYDGSIRKHKRVTLLTGAEASVESDVPVLLEADGESLGHSPFRFRIIPRAVRVIVNRETKD